MLKVAITGNIASGKSTVEGILRQKGYKVLDTDFVVHELFEDESVKKLMVFVFAGLDILELRVERCYLNCMKLGKFFDQNPNVKRVDYPGLRDSAYYNLAVSQFGGIPGTVMTFDLESQELCYRFMNRLKIIRRATNLNDNKSLIIHPYSTIYAEFPENDRLEMGVRPTMMRLSVGIEGAEDLIEDILQALE